MTTKNTDVVHDISQEVRRIELDEEVNLVELHENLEIIKELIEDTMKKIRTKVVASRKSGYKE
jgi:hypothetical protein